MPTQVAESADAASSPSYVRASGWLYYSVLLLALAAAIIPFWLVRYTGMMDYTAHLARCYILAHFHANPAWAQDYRVAWGPIPNLAIDAFVVPLAHWLPIVVSGKLFLTLTAMLYVLGCDALGRAVWGRRHWMALAAAFTFFNTNLTDGRVNYMFGLALFFWVFTFWLRARGRMTARRFLLLCGFSLAVYMAHLGAVAVLGLACVTVALLDFARDRRPGRLAAEVGWLACPALLSLFGFLRQSGSVGRLDWGTWTVKASHLFTLVRTYDLRMDLLLFLGYSLAAALLLWHARWRREVAIAALVLLAGYVALPMRIFTADYADARLVAPAFVLLMVALKPRPGRGRAAALAVVIALLLLRVGYITSQWRAADSAARQVLAAGAALPPGARVDVLDGSQGKSGVQSFRRLALSHVVDFWAISRGAYMSNVFALAGQQPLIQRPDLQTCWPTAGKHCLAHFDYVWTDRPAPPLAARLRRAAVPVSQWNGLTLWRLR